MPPRTPPARRQPLVNQDLTPSSRAANFFEELALESASISDIALTAPSANEILLRDGLNDILAVLRERGLLSET